MTDRTPVWLALSNNKTPLRKGQLDGPSGIAPSTAAELAAAPMRGVVPRSLGLVLIDIDAGELPADERVAAVERIFGPALGKHPSRREGGWHLWYAADCDFTLGSFNLDARLYGDVKHDRQYAVVYDRDTLEVAADKVNTARPLQHSILATLCDRGWSGGSRHTTLLRRSWSAAANGQDPATVGRIAREAGKPQGEIDRALSKLPAGRVASGLKLSQRDWARAFNACYDVADMAGKTFRFENLQGWLEVNDDRAGEMVGGFIADMLADAEIRAGGELMALLEGNGPVDPKAQMAIVKNVNGIGAIRKEFGNVGVIKTIAKFAGRIAADLPWNPEPEVCGLPGARKLDLRTGATAWAKPEDRISMALAAAPADTLDPRWDAFLREALGRRSDGSSFPDVAERIEHMQMLCGAMAIGRATEDIVVLRGGEGTGKSTLQDAVENALGSYCVATNGERLVGTDTTHDAWKMPLAHARALSVAEMPDTGRGWRGSLMKAITSGNTIEASWKGKDPVRFRSAAVIFVTCNTMPAAYGQLLGLKRRFSLYAMDYELPHDGTKDALTGEELRPTVVRWIIDGARALLNRGGTHAG